MLVQRFEQSYDVEIANTPELLDEVYQLRYRVFCEQGKVPGFLPECYPDSRETDHYDERSVHCLVRHRVTRKPVATVRLIRSCPVGPDDRLPVEKDLSHVFYPHVTDPKQLPRPEVAEISRLIVTRSYWKNGHVRRTADMNDCAQDAHHPILGVFAGLNRLAVKHGIRYMFGTTRPVFQRLLRQFGIRMRPIGPVVDYYGRRQPHLGIVTEMLSSAAQHSPELWDLFTNRGQFVPEDAVLPMVGEG